MIDKVQKIREEVEKIKTAHSSIDLKESNPDVLVVQVCTNLLFFIDSLQEEPNITCIKSKHATGKLKECIDNASKAKLNAMLDDALSKETKESWNEKLDKKDFRERYKRITQSESFKKAHEGISIGDVVPVEGEEPVSKVWHDASEKCVGDKDVLFHSTYDNRWYVSKVGQLNQNVVDKWAYIEDILKL